jgi:hypothetical protein
MNSKRNQTLAWIFWGLIAIFYITALGFYLSTRSESKIPSIFELTFPFTPVIFALVGVLIISRQPRNLIGLLLMLPSLSLFTFVDAYLQPYIDGVLLSPSPPTSLFLLVLWFSNWNWLLLVFPIMFIMVLFPTGKSLNPRWNWLIYFGLGIIIIFVLLITFAQSLAPGSGDATWIVLNPIGFLKTEWIDVIVTPMLIAVPLWIVSCAISLFVRFRQARAFEREQLKWLFYAGAIFVVFYLPSFIGDTYSQAENLWNLLLPIGMMAFPVAIAIAILRYHLYDIDVIIRRTLQYAILTGLLVLVYFGSVVLLQSLFETLTGQQSPVVIVISTLAIAALFNPLRIRIQAFIDRRFYRKKYDAEQALANFAAIARDEVDLDKLTVSLLQVVEQTMQPERVSLWLKPSGKLSITRNLPD